MGKIIDNYLRSEQKVIGYDAWGFLYTKKDSNRISCAKLIEKDGNIFSTSSNIVDIENVDKKSCVIQDVIDVLTTCIDANVITIHVNDYKVVKMLKFGHAPKRLSELVARYKKLVRKTEVIFVKDKWYEVDCHNRKVERCAKVRYSKMD